MLFIKQGYFEVIKWHALARQLDVTPEIQMLNAITFEHVGLYDVDPLRFPVKRGKSRSAAGLFLHLKNLGKKNE